MLVNVQDRGGNQFTILTEAAIVISGQTIFSRPHFVQRIPNGAARIDVEHTRFVAEATGDCPVTVAVYGAFVMLNQDIFLDRSIRLPWIFICMQKAVRTKLARARAMSLAMGYHPRLGARSLIRTLPTDLVRRIALLV